MSKPQSKAASGLEPPKQVSVTDAAASVEKSVMPMDPDDSSVQSQAKSSTVVKEVVSIPGTSSSEGILKCSDLILQHQKL